MRLAGGRRGRFLSSARRAKTLIASSTTPGTTRASTDSTAESCCGGCSARPGYHAFDWTVSVGTLLAGKHFELDEILLVREASDPGRYTRMVDDLFSNPAGPSRALVAVHARRAVRTPSPAAPLHPGPAVPPERRLPRDVLPVSLPTVRRGRVSCRPHRRARDGRSLAWCARYAGPARHDSSRDRAPDLRRARHGRAARSAARRRARTGWPPPCGRIWQVWSSAASRARPRRRAPTASTSSTSRGRAPGWPAPAISPRRCSDPRLGFGFPPAARRRAPARPARVAAPLRGGAPGRPRPLRARRPQRLPGHDRVPAGLAARPRVLSRDAAASGADGSCVLGGRRPRHLLLDRRSRSRRAPVAGDRRAIDRRAQLRGRARLRAASGRRVRRRRPGALHRHHALSAELLRRRRRSVTTWPRRCPDSSSGSSARRRTGRPGSPATCVSWAASRRPPPRSRPPGWRWPPCGTAAAPD